MDSEVQNAVELLIKRGVINPKELVRLAQIADALGGRAPNAGPARKQRRQRVQISREALQSYLKDHSAREAAEHFAVSIATITNKKKAFGLTKRKAGGKKKTRSKKKSRRKAKSGKK